MNTQEAGITSSNVLYSSRNMVVYDNTRVEFPELGLTIDGGWNWGPHNQTKPGLVATMYGAKQVAIAHLHEAICKGSIENTDEVIVTIDQHLGVVLAGVPTIKWDNTVTRHTTVEVNEVQYDVIRKTVWGGSDVWGDSSLRLTNTFTWNARDFCISNTFTVNTRSKEQRLMIGDRSTSEFFKDLIPYVASLKNKNLIKGHPFPLGLVLVE